MLVLPTPLRAGVRYPIGGTVLAPVGLHNPDVYGGTQYGRRALRKAAEAEAGLFWGHTRLHVVASPPEKESARGPRDPGALVCRVRDLADRLPIGSAGHPRILCSRIAGRIPHCPVDG